MKKSFEITLILIITFTTVIHLLHYILETPTLDYFNSNTLINYSQGFVRRGLSGELILLLSNLLGANPLYIIKALNLILVASFLLYFVKSIVKYHLSFYFFVFPFVLPFLILDDIINFKDFFTLILFIFLVKTAVSSKVHGVLQLVLLNIISIVAILNHEMSFFIFIPALLMIKYFINASRKKNVAQLFFLLPSFIVLLLCIHYSGTVTQANDILTSYKNLPNNHLKIDQLSDKATFLLPKFFTTITWNGFSRGITSIFYIAQILILLTFFDKIKTSFKRYQNTLDPSVLVMIYLVLLCCFLPIFFIAYDWHRFLFLILMSTLIIGIEMHKQEIKSNSLPHFALLPMQLLKKLISYFIVPEKSLLLIIGFFGLIPHVAMGNTSYQFSNLYLIILNYATKVTSVLF